ncbi:MAG: hypothetical protein AAFR11_15565 [Pseudomonadota bacterium]
MATSERRLSNRTDQRVLQWTIIAMLFASAFALTFILKGPDDSSVRRPLVGERLF